jgi:hypothetical protein
LPALGCLSCSGGAALNPVHGKVLYKDQPAGGAVVTFHPEGGTSVTAIPTVGRTNEDGTFTLTTGDKEGAPAGTYVVTVIWPEEVKPKGITTAPPESRDRLQGKYAEARGSALKVEIKKGDNQLEPFRLN